MSAPPKYLITAGSIEQDSWDGSSADHVSFTVMSQDYLDLSPGDSVRIAHDKNTEPGIGARSIFDYVVISTEELEDRKLRIRAGIKTSPNELLQETLEQLMPSPPQWEWTPKPNDYTARRSLSGNHPLATLNQWQNFKKSP